MSQVARRSHSRLNGFPRFVVSSYEARTPRFMGDPAARKTTLPCEFEEDSTVIRDQIGNSGGRKWLILVAVACVALAVFVAQGSAGDPPGGKKMQREIRIFERVMDDMLIDSPNWLVPGRDNARGYYVPGHGPIFTYEASLVSRGWGRGSSFKIFGSDHFVFWDDDDEDEDYYDDDEDDRDRKSRRKSREKMRDNEARRYDRGKQEVIDVFLDYGDSFETMKAGEWVTVVAYLDDADYFDDNDISHLVMKAKVDDLRAFGSGSLSEENLVAKIVVEEY